MKHFQIIRKRMSRLSFKVFLLLIFCLIIPMFCMFSYMKSNFEQYIQDELSNKIIQGMARSEQGIYKSLQNMANLSSVIVMNKNLEDTMSDPNNSYYNKTLAFDSAVKNLMAANLFTINDIKITFLDVQGNIYSNWSMDYHDYSFLFNQNWVQESIKQKGHTIWSMFSPGYIIEPNQKEEKYISLARSMLSDGITGNRIGTLIISIGQSQFNDLLMQYSYSQDDLVYVCLNNGDILLKNKPQEPLPDAHVKAKVGLVPIGSSGSLRDEYQGKQYLVSYYTLSEPWTFNGQRLVVMYYTDYRGVLTQMNKLSQQIDLSMMAFFVVIVLLMSFISTRLVKPIRVLARQMQVYSIDKELHGLDMARQDEIGHLNRAFSKMLDNIRELFSKLNHEHEVREKYQFEALRAQVNPHFLFNTLNMIRWMAIIRKADNIVESIDALVNMLKFSMSRGGELVSLEEELSNIRSYVFIQNSRFGNRYEVKIDISPELLPLQVIKFILQPVVENAVIHGFDEESGTIWIYGEREEDILKLYVKDNGKGIPPDIINKFSQSKDMHRDEKKLTGIGLANVNERIQVTYGEQFGIQIDSRLGEGTLVTYTLPAIEGSAKAIEEGHDR